jgi:hypothetical protein
LFWRGNVAFVLGRKKTFAPTVVHLNSDKT